MRRWILASASPRRKELLHQMGLEFDIIPATEEEKSRETIPERYVTELARHKAQEVSKSPCRTEGKGIGWNTDCRDRLRYHCGSW